MNTHTLRIASLIVTLGIAVALVAVVGCGSNSTHTDSGPSGSTDSGGGPSADSGGPGTDAARPDPDSGPPINQAWFEAPRSQMQLFASGHSLLDRVFGPPLRDGGPFTALAQAAGKTHTSLLQDGAGSTAWLRHQDIDNGRYPEPNWAEFDTLIICERADLAGSVIYENGIRELGWFVDQITQAAPGGDELFLYQTWPGYNDGNRVELTTRELWLAYTRAELPLTECVAERIGRERRLRMRVIPAGNALAELVEAIMQNEAHGLTFDDIYEDGIHLTDLGDTFIAMVAFAAAYRTPTTGLSVPGISAEHAAYFASIADRLVPEYYANYRAPTAAECREHMQTMCELGRFNQWECGQGREHFEDAAYGDPL